MRPIRRNGKAGAYFRQRIWGPGIGRIKMNKAKEKAYEKMVQKVSPNSNHLLDCLRAFLVGGLICTLAQGIMEALMAWAKVPPATPESQPMR